jgi:Clp amino terminal domain, pathogenicity island component
MQATAAPTAAVRNALSGAYGAATRTRQVGTEHLLLGLLTRGPAGRALDEFGVTPVSVAEIVRQANFTATDEAAPDDDTGPLDDLEWFGSKQSKPMNYTGAARAALHRAIATAGAAERTEFDPDDVLDALLAAPNRATEAITRCGVDPAGVRERLTGGPAPESPTLAADLEPTRAAVLGIEPYRVGSFTGRMAYGFLRAVNANLARTPVPWADLEARDQAARLGHRKVRTAHLLLALLAMHEVTRDLPHLVVDVPARYAGARALAGAGLTYAAVRAALEADPPGRDPRRYKSYVDARRDTSALLSGILSGDTSAARLLTALGVGKPVVS